MKWRLKTQRINEQKQKADSLLGGRLGEDCSMRPA
jgi:hypothetical protein